MTNLEFIDVFTDIFDSVLNFITFVIILNNN